MPISKAQKAAVKRYTEAHYEMISIRVPKGYRQKVQQAAAAAGMSLASYIKAAVDAAMDKAPE